MENIKLNYETTKSEPIIERQSSVVNTIHYTDKTDNSVYGFDSEQDAKQLYKNFDNLVPMSDELFQQYKNRPDGGEWTVDGWKINKKLEASEKAEKERLKLEAEQQKLDELIDEAESKISLIKRYIERGRKVDENKKLLDIWEDYSLDLRDVDINNPKYPKKPA